MLYLLPRHLFVCLIALCGPGQPATTGEALERARTFLTTLDAQQRGQTLFPFDSPQRLQWRRTPGERAGVAIADLDDRQRAHAHRMLRSVLSTQGYLKAASIMLNEDIQAREEPSLGQERYWIAVFGEPSEAGPWSWRIEGHHLSMHFTFRGTELISASPSSFGMHPAEIKSEGPRTGLKVLAAEEESARRLARALREAGRTAAFGQGTPPEALYAESAAFEAAPEGLRVGEMTAAQQALVRALIAAYVDNYESGYAARIIDRLAVDDLRFVWYGGLEPGEGHYYRLQGDRFIIEYHHYGPDSYGGNHIHCLWRDLDNDFGL